jgi:hypothetical protein
MTNKNNKIKFLAVAYDVSDQFDHSNQEIILKDAFEENHIIFKEYELTQEQLNSMKVFKSDFVNRAEFEDEL